MADRGTSGAALDALGMAEATGRDRGALEGRREAAAMTAAAAAVAAVLLACCCPPWWKCSLLCCTSVASRSELPEGRLNAEPLPLLPLPAFPVS